MQNQVWMEKLIWTGKEIASNQKFYNPDEYHKFPKNPEKELKNRKIFLLDY